MVSETYKNSQDQALEERPSNMHEQMAGVTSRWIRLSVPLIWSVHPVRISSRQRWNAGYVKLKGVSV